MTKERRSNKWAFLIYKESAPDNYLEILNGLHVPFVLSPWHDKDIYSGTGELKKSHKHGAFYFDSLKSYTQVSELVSDKLNGPAHVEVVMSPKGMFDYFTHAENPSKTPYDVENIESGAGFELDKFLLKQNTDNFMNDVIDIIEENNFMEFEDLVRYARDNNYLLLGLIVERTYFFAKYLDSRRYSKGKKPYKQQEEQTDE
ncbi:replication protein [Enterococcus faecalis]|uniref:replication protein n=1 Tax=Enterococcus faecalis TaxID=1351 RepID=UPI000CF226B5|nr:replication protein [Enterococcus faecalis]EGO7732745.1 Replication protein RepB [Enterococcus faecalis]EGO8021771.1 Replication protein RepB [Enterococcus faecalis]EGO8086421.1 Replication protein RepB [Enterococcus faecalis]EGO8108418.1 Replication protein RepB [Enterococcus faecalis]EGO8112892.1 Replication protein RepB [Enterococcus faecalis]